MSPKKKALSEDYLLLKGDVLRKLHELPDAEYDLVITSPPYNIGKIYERGSSMSFDEYYSWLDKVIGALATKLKDTGSICWQVGNYVKGGEVFPLDVFFYDSFKSRGLQLRNRIIWQFNFGLHSNKRLSGRYETILWFSKSADYKFNLDPIRIPQSYPGKRHPSKRKNGAGELSGNPLGKNPSDYWEFSADEYFKSNAVWKIPNVKANHPEKTIHPCQFPIELVERCVLALTDPKDIVLDPFVGTGTSVLAALKHERRGVGIDRDPNFLKIAAKRISALKSGTLKARPMDRMVHQPNVREKVARMPHEWIASSRKESRF